jgi:hypothetical protein
MDRAMTNAAGEHAVPGGTDSEHRHDGRAQVDIDCEIRIGNRAWRRARLADLTPDGFQVAILDMPARGTPLYIRFAGIQMLQAEVCWARADTAGCRFAAPMSPYVFDHIIASIA